VDYLLFQRDKVKGPFLYNRTAQHKSHASEGERIFAITLVLDSQGQLAGHCPCGIPSLNEYVLIISPQRRAGIPESRVKEIPGVQLARVECPVNCAVGLTASGF